MACKTLNHVEHLLILTSTFTAVGSPVGILQFCSWIKILCIKARIKEYKSIIKQKTSKNSIVSRNSFK